MGRDILLRGVLKHLINKRAQERLKPSVVYFSLPVLGQAAPQQPEHTRMTNTKRAENSSNHDRDNKEPQQSHTALRKEKSLRISFKKCRENTATMPRHTFLKATSH